MNLSKHPFLITLLLSGSFAFWASAELLIENVIRKKVPGLGEAPIASDFERGFRFELTVDALATHLSLYDVDQDGLAGAYRVTLWDSTGDVLARMPVGPADPFDASGQFRTVALPTPVVLAADTIYVLSANYQDVLADDELLGAAVDGGRVSPLATLLDSETLVPVVLAGNNAIYDPNPKGDPVFPTLVRYHSHGGTVSLQFTPLPGPDDEPVSILRIEYDSGSDTTSLEFYTRENISYVIEASEDLQHWGPKSEEFLASSGDLELVTMLGFGVGQRFFRVRYEVLATP